MIDRLTLSIVVPLFNEEESLAALVDAIRHALTGSSESWELVLVDDGSMDGTADIAARLAASDSRIRLVRLAWNYGQTQAMRAGFDHARGEVVVSMDGDLQNDPQDIHGLVEKLREGYDLVAGYRVRRRDTLITRKLPSWFANRLIAWLTGVRIRDNGCSLKAYRRSLLDQLHLYSDMHRFLPALAAATAAARIAEIPVRHHARRFGRSKYGLSRITKILADLLTIKMISSFRERPLAMFGSGALVAAALGTAFGLAPITGYGVFGIEYAIGHAHDYVLPSAAMLWLMLACYLLMLGLVAEVALRKARQEEQLGFQTAIEHVP
ncbi:MAG: glycosyltransferase family 2 protein [Chloroflexota bacterium]|nr:glycosyltransferase family 2 protein [Chloroflexota bacterium]